jgi:hypothetical protein
MGVLAAINRIDQIKTGAFAPGLVFIVLFCSGFEMV